METLFFIVGVLAVALGLAASIALHELGHLIPAKLFNIKVTRYMIGFGPTVFSRKRGETVYGIKALPLGGFVSMTGMYPPAREGAKLTRLAANAHKADAEESEGVPPERMLYNLAPWKRVVIMFGGPFTNFVIAAVLFAVMISGFGSQQPTTTLASVSQCVAAAVSEDNTCPEGSPAPALEAGLQTGDTIVSFNGQKLESWEQLTALIRETPGEEAELAVTRGGEQFTTTITPAASEFPYVKDGAVVTGTVGAVGMESQVQAVREPLTAVIPHMADSVVMTVKAVANLPEKFTGVVRTAAGAQERDADSPVSVVGVGRIAGEVTTLDGMAATDKAAMLVGLLGAVNLALFVFNLIPLLPLDGGHIVGALWDALRRRVAKLMGKPQPVPFDQTRLLPVSLGVAALMLSGGLLLIYVDIVKPISLF